MRLVFFSTTHVLMLAIGFALGVYFLPILTAPKGPASDKLIAMSKGALYKAKFQRGLKGNDFLHWGEGEISISSDKIVHSGELAPGPDYKLYLVSEFVEDEEAFLKVKSTAIRVGDVRTFNGFILDVPKAVDVNRYTTVLVWCEAFGEFITAAKYR